MPEARRFRGQESLQQITRPDVAGDVAADVAPRGRMSPDGCCGSAKNVATSSGHPKSPERPPQNLRFVAPAEGPKLHSGHPACGVAQGECFPPGRVKRAINKMIHRFPYRSTDGRWCARRLVAAYGAPAKPTPASSLSSTPGTPVVRLRIRSSPRTALRCTTPAVSASSPSSHGRGRRVSDPPVVSEPVAARHQRYSRERRRS